MTTWQRGASATQGVVYESDTLLQNRLSTAKSISARLCLTHSPARPQAVCIAKISNANRSSRRGPLHTNQRFRIVKLLDSVTRPVSSSTLTRTSFSLCRIFNTAPTIGRSGRSGVNTATEGSSNPVRALKRGRRCRGHGTSANNCGAEYTKLKWRWTQFRFETKFSTPDIRINPGLLGKYDYLQSQKDFPSSTSTKSVRDSAVSWTKFLLDLRDKEAVMQIRRQESCIIRNIERSWDLMPPDMVDMPSDAS